MWSIWRCHAQLWNGRYTTCLHIRCSHLFTAWLTSLPIRGWCTPTQLLSIPAQKTCVHQKCCKYACCPSAHACTQKHMYTHTCTHTHTHANTYAHMLSSCSQDSGKMTAGNQSSSSGADQIRSDQCFSCRCWQAYARHVHVTHPSQRPRRTVTGCMLTCSLAAHFPACQVSHLPAGTGR